jgi:hypothetical protein
MKRITYLALAVAILMAGFTVRAVAQSDSLGDYARQTRKQKAQKPSTAKQFDNDNLPTNDKLSVVGNAPAENADADNDADNDTRAAAQQPDAQGDAPKAETKPGESQQDRQKAYDEWKDRIAKQKEAVDSAAHELDLLQREYRLRAAAFYADAGNRLRNAGSWDKEDAQFKQQIADKQKSVDAAKQKLDEMQESARKAGVPSSMRE